MKRAISLLPFLAIVLLCGCSPKEEAAPKKSVSQLDAEITKIQNDNNMPMQAKNAVLSNLQRERDAAAKSQAGTK